MLKYQLGAVTQMAMSNYYGRSDTEKSVMNLPFILYLKGTMDVKRLENSIKKVMNAEALHTYLTVEGSTFYANVRDNYSFVLEVEDAIGTSESEKLEYVSNFSKSKALEPLPLFNSEKNQSYFKLFRIDEEYHILLMIVHHTFLDFGAIMIAMNHIFGYYNDDNFKIPEGSEVSKFINEETAFYQTEDAKKEDEFWSKSLANVKKPTLIAESKSLNTKPINKEELIALFNRAELESIATKNRTSMFNIIMLIIHMAIAKVNGTNDTLTQYAISNRSDREYRFTLGCLTRVLNNPVTFDDDMNTFDLNKLMRKKMGDGYQNRHVAGKTILGSIPYVIANEDMKDLDVFPMFNGSPVKFDLVSSSRSLKFIIFLILPVGTDNVAIKISTDVTSYGKHSMELINAIKLAGQFLTKYPNRTFEDFMRKDITLDTLSILDSDDDIEIIEI